MRKTRKKIEVSLVILTRNSSRVVPRLLDSIRRQRVSFSYEIIFLDNSSSDGTVAILERVDFCPRQIVNIPEGQFSHSRTRLRALELASGATLVFFTDDIVPIGEEFLEKLTAPVRNREAAAAYGVYQIAKEQDALEHYLHNGWYKSFADFSEPIPQYCWKILPPQSRRRLINFDNCSSCINREILRKHPFPDTHYGEDMLFAKQLILNGERVALAREARFYHWHRVTFKYIMRRMCIDADISRRELDLKFTASYNQVARAVLKRVLHRTFLILFKVRVNPWKKLRLIFYHAKILSGDFIGKFMGGLQESESSHWKPGYRWFYRKKLRILEEIEKKSIHRPLQ